MVHVCGCEITCTHVGFTLKIPEWPRLVIVLISWTTLAWGIDR